MEETFSSNVHRRKFAQFYLMMICVNSLRFLQKNWPIPPSFCSFSSFQHYIKYILQKAQKLCLGFKPGAAGIVSTDRSTDPLSNVSMLVLKVLAEFTEHNIIEKVSHLEKQPSCGQYEPSQHVLTFKRLAPTYLHGGIKDALRTYTLSIVGTFFAIATICDDRWAGKERSP